MKELKENIIRELVEQLNASPFAIVADYSGTSVAEFEGIRVKLAEGGATAHVTKNSYIKRASSEVSYPEELAEFLSGQTVLVTGEEDICAAAKVLKDFNKKSEKFGMRGGILDGKVVSAEELSALASLPPMDVLRAQLLGTLQSPASTFVRLLNEPASALARVLKAKEDQG